MQNQNQVLTVSNGINTGRDDRGRFAQGNTGKPPGAKNHLREKVKTFVESNIAEMQTHYDRLDAKDKIKVLTDLLPFVISKLQSVHQSDAEGNDIKRVTRIDLTKLSDSALHEVLNATQNETTSDYSH